MKLTIGTSNIIDVIVNFKTNISKFILASSRSVYGEGGYFCKKCNDVYYPQQRSATEIKEFGDLVVISIILNFNHCHQMRVSILLHNQSCFIKTLSRRDS